MYWNMDTQQYVYREKRKPSSVDIFHFLILFRVFQSFQQHTSINKIQFDSVSTQFSHFVLAGEVVCKQAVVYKICKSLGSTESRQRKNQERKIEDEHFETQPRKKSVAKSGAELTLISVFCCFLFSLDDVINVGCLVARESKNQKLYSREREVFYYCHFISHFSYSTCARVTVGLWHGIQIYFNSMQIQQKPF